MATVAELVAKIEADTSGMRSGIDAANKKMDQFEKNTSAASRKIGLAFSGLQAAVVALGLQMGARLLGSVVSTITTFEKLEATLRTITGSAEAAQAAFSKLQNFAATTPFQLEEVVGAFVKLKALGLDPSEAALNSYGNTASALGKSLNQMIEAVADASTGEFERLKEFGIKARQEGENITFTFQGVATTVRRTSSEIENYLRGIGQNQFGDAMAQQSDTLNVSLSNLQDSVSKLIKSIGDAGLTDALKGVADAAREAIDAITGLVNQTFNLDKYARMQSLAKLDSEIQILTARIEKLSQDPGFLNWLTEKVGVGNVGVSVLNGNLQTLINKRNELAKDVLKNDFMSVLGEGLDKIKGPANDNAPKKSDAIIGGKLGGSGKDPIEELLGGKPQDVLNELNDYYLTQEEQEIAHHQRRIDAIRGYLDQHKDMTAAQRKQLEDIEQKHVDVMMSKLEKQSDAKMRQQGEEFGNLIAQAAQHNRAFFELNKVRVIAESLLKARQSVVNAYEFGTKLGGPVIGAAFAATAAAATAVNIAAIASTQYGGGGGSVSSGGGGRGGGALPGSASTTNAGNSNIPQELLPRKELTIRLEGSRYSDKEIRELIDRINDQVGDNVTLRAA